MGFGKLLEQKMKSKGVKQAELAEAVGLPKATLSSMILRDNTKIEIEKFLKICEYLNCNPEDFYPELKKDQRMPPVFAMKYNQLDSYGKDLMNMVLEKEFDRCTGHPVQQTRPSIVIQMSPLKVSAGGGEWLCGDEPLIRARVADTPTEKEYII